MTTLTDKNLLEQLENTTCFGRAYDAKARECKLCDLARQCDAKSKEHPLDPELLEFNAVTQAALEEAKAKKASRSTRKVKKYPDNMPDPKNMSTDEIEALVRERGGEIKEYDDPKIYRMRLVMSLTETYK